MRFKGTLFLLIGCLALAGYIYFYEIKGGNEREKAEQERNQVWKLESKDIQQVDLIYPDERITAVRSSDSDWRITVPRPLQADSDELGRLARSGADLRREDLVETTAADLSRFGLSPARFRATFRTKSGKEYEISFGNSNPTGSYTYAAVPGGNEVFLLQTSVADSFNKKLEDLRNHSVLSFDQTETHSVELKSSKGHLNLVNEGDRWWITGEEKLAADSPDVRDLLNSLSLARIREYFDDDPNEYETLGFDNPIVDARITYGKNDAVKHLIIGKARSRLVKKQEKSKLVTGLEREKASSTELYLAKDESRPELFFVEADLVDKLAKSASDLRDKTLAAFQRWDIDFIALTNSKGFFTFTKSGGEWLLGDAGKKAKWDAVSGILDCMESQVKGFVDKPAPLSIYGLDHPVLRVVLKQGGTVKADCAFGKDAEDGIYAQVRGESSVKVADKESFDKLNRGESDFMETHAPAAAAEK